MPVMGPGGATVKTASPRQAGPPITAPDGITVYPIDITPSAHLALAKGDIQPGHTYGIHAHLTLEQVTYVLSGRIRAITYDPDRGEPREIVAATGDSVVTLPGESLQFAAEGRYARASPIRHQPALPRRPHRHHHPGHPPSAQQRRTRMLPRAAGQSPRRLPPSS